MAAALIQLTACAAPSYYAQAISGHLELMRQRKDISAMLDSPATDPKLAEELALSVEIRKFAVTQLQLPDNGSYTQFAQTGREAVTWNVVAAPEFSLTPRQWCFLFAGCVPYRGYFKLQDAEKFAGKLAGDGYDTAVSPAIAYSTLGWFSDPLLDTMLQYSNQQLAAYIFHELAHQKLYVSGDTAFNESYASFIEETGVRLWLAASGEAGQLPGWLKRQRAGLEFDALLRDMQARLLALYASGQPAETMRSGKSAIFQGFREEYGLLVENRWDGVNYYAALLARDLNNADLALVYSYHSGICAFEMLYREAGNNMARFQQLSAARAGLRNEQRRAWLNQPCEIIASGSDL